ncbi:GUN4-like [Limnospira platensis C1]|nr:GUN4-like [Arthrospira platensis C1]
MVSQLQSYGDKMTQPIDGFIQSLLRLGSQILKAIASPLQWILQLRRKILKAKSDQSQSPLQPESPDEAIASQLQPISEPVPRKMRDYTELDRLLKSGNWKAADQETAKMMLAVAGKTQRGYLDEESIKNFPCDDLRIIDGLWVKHSNGRFGFSVQKQIYINCGGKPDGSYPGATIFERYCDEVGWRVNGSYLSSWSDCTFSAAAPRGHLPYPRAPRRFLVGWRVNGSYLSSWSDCTFSKGRFFTKLFSRAQTCNL